MVEGSEMLPAIAGELIYNATDAWLKGDADAMKVFKSGGGLSRDRGWKDFASKNF